MSFDKMSFDKMSFDKMSFDKMSFDKMSFDKMSVKKMSVDKISVNKMSVDKMSLEKVPLDKMSWNLIKDFMNHPNFMRLHMSSFVSYACGQRLLQHLAISNRTVHYQTPMQENKS